MVDAIRSIKTNGIHVCLIDHKINVFLALFHGSKVARVLNVMTASIIRKQNTGISYINKVKFNTNFVSSITYSSFGDHPKKILHS